MRQRLGIMGNETKIETEELGKKHFQRWDEMRECDSVRDYELIAQIPIYMWQSFVPLMSWHKRDHHTVQGWMSQFNRKWEEEVRRRRKWRRRGRRGRRRRRKRKRKRRKRKRKRKIERKRKRKRKKNKKNNNNNKKRNKEKKKENKVKKKKN